MDILLFFPHFKCHSVQYNIYSPNNIRLTENHSHVQRSCTVWRRFVPSGGELATIQRRLQILEITLSSGHVNCVNVFLCEN